MTDFNSLDLKHKRAVISHVQLFQMAVNRLTSNFVSPKQKEILIDEMTAETQDFVNFFSDEQVNNIIKSIEHNLTNIIQ